MLKIKFTRYVINKINEYTFISQKTVNCFYIVNFFNKFVRKSTLNYCATAIEKLYIKLVNSLLTLNNMLKLDC